MPLSLVRPALRVRRPCATTCASHAADAHKPTRARCPMRVLRWHWRALCRSNAVRAVLSSRPAISPSPPRSASTPLTCICLLAPRAALTRLLPSALRRPPRRSASRFRRRRGGHRRSYPARRFSALARAPRRHSSPEQLQLSNLRANRTQALTRNPSARAGVTQPPASMAECEMLPLSSSPHCASPPLLLATH